MGCSGDDTNGGTTDASTDTTSDHFVPDTGTSDGAGEGGADASDSGSPDAPADAPKDAPVDAPSLADFGHQIDLALCTRLTSCCLVDAGSFNVAQCVTDQEQFAGGTFGLQGTLAPALDGGRIAYDKAKAAACIAAVANIPCGLLSAAQLHGFRDQCFAAIQGTSGIDGGCGASIECMPAEYCDKDAGVCHAVKAAGAACNPANDEQCSYLGHGTPTDYCNSQTNTCTPQSPLDAGCGSFRECATQLCNGNCANDYVVSDPGVPNGTCDYYTIKDAGGGG